MNDRLVEKFVLQSLKESRASDEKAHRRSLPVYYEDVSNLNPVSILEQYISMWEPRDLRLDPIYQETHEVIVTDSEFMQDVSKGIELIIEQRIPTKNTIRVAVMFQHNMSEFERYNDFVDAHNSEWIERGCPEDVFDPTTGDVFEVKDKYINHAGDDSGNPFGVSTGALASARPKRKRRKLLTITYKLNLLPESKMFQLNFVAEDYNGKVVYHNSLKHKNLAYLTRRATQELYGNPEEHGNEGPFLEGISMLITGKKIKRCASNEIPEGVNTNYKSPVVNQVAMATNAVGIRVVGNVIKYLIPLVCAFFLIKETIVSFYHWNFDGIIIIYATNLLAIYLSVLASGWLFRKAYSIELESKFV